MPTPSGMLKAGDHVLALAPDPQDDVELEVVERIGSGSDYSIRVRRVDGRPATADGHMQKIWTEVGYYLNQGQNSQHRIGTKWRQGLLLVKPDEVRMRQVMQACFDANPDIPPARVRRIVELAFGVAKVKLQP